MKLDYYSEDVLRQLQNIELQILKEFSQICDQNDIDWFLIGGSAIGAVRHGGFIPWDDDIDVGMAREDYDKFLKIALENYSDKYTIMNHEHNNSFPLMNTRWGLNGTEYKTEDLKDVKGNFGIFLDIFCFDNVPDNEKEMIKQGKRAWIWGKLMVLSGVKYPVLYYYGFTAKVLKVFFYIAHHVLKILHLTPNYFYKKAYKWCALYKNENTRRFAYMFEPKKFVSMLNKEDIYPTQKMKFEDIEANVPNNIDKLLTKRYGDYMTLPPEDKRHIHPPYNLEFGIYGKEGD